MRREEDAEQRAGLRVCTLCCYCPEILDFSFKHLSRIFILHWAPQIMQQVSEGVFRVVWRKSVAHSSHSQIFHIRVPWGSLKKKKKVLMSGSIPRHRDLIVLGCYPSAGRFKSSLSPMCSKGWGTLGCIMRRVNWLKVTQSSKKELGVFERKEEKSSKVRKGHRLQSPPPS